MISRGIRGAIIGVLVIGGGILIGQIFGGSSSDDTTTTTATTTSDPTTAGPADYAGFVAQPTACGAEAPPPPQELNFDAPEDQGLTGESTVTATIVTSCGDVVIDLDPAGAPESVNSFVFLARAGYFDGTAAHRIVPGFVVQAGDPTATGVGGPGYVISDEFPAEGFSYGRGVVAMANAGPGTTGSQFFIILDDTPLQAQFNVLGTVSSGFDVVDRIAGVSLGFASSHEQSSPLESVYIEQVTVAVG